MRTDRLYPAHTAPLHPRTERNPLAVEGVSQKRSRRKSANPGTRDGDRGQHAVFGSLPNAGGPSKGKEEGVKGFSQPPIRGNSKGTFVFIVIHHEVIQTIPNNFLPVQYIASKTRIIIPHENWVLSRSILMVGLGAGARARESVNSFHRVWLSALP